VSVTTRSLLMKSSAFYDAPNDFRYSNTGRASSPPFFA
jgi:hypothetical protein